MAVWFSALLPDCFCQTLTIGSGVGHHHPVACSYQQRTGQPCFCDRERDPATAERPVSCSRRGVESLPLAGQELAPCTSELATPVTVREFQLPFQKLDTRTLGTWIGGSTSTPNQSPEVSLVQWAPPIQVPKVGVKWVPFIEDPGATKKAKTRSANVFFELTGHLAQYGSAVTQ